MNQRKIHQTLRQIEKLTKSLPTDWATTAFDNVRRIAYPENAIIIWQPDDVQGLRPDWDMQRCIEWLADHADTIRDRSIEEGWEIIEILLQDEPEDCDECDGTTEEHEKGCRYRALTGGI